MANVNKVIMIARLGKDPEIRAFAGGGRVAQLRVAVNNRKKDPNTGQWVDDPCWLDCKAYDRETGRKLAEVAERFLRKGSQVYIEGHLKMEEWNDKTTGEKRSKLLVQVDDFQLLDPRPDGGMGGGGGGMTRPTATVPARKPAPAPAPAAAFDSDGGFEEPQQFEEHNGNEGDIPF